MSVVTVRIEDEDLIELLSALEDLRDMDIDLDWEVDE